MALGVLYHMQSGSYIQPVEGQAGYLVNYTMGQLYGICSDDQLATPDKLAIRGLAFRLLPADFDQTKYKWNPVTFDVDAIAAKPIAKISTKDAQGAAQSLFATSEAITVRAEIWKPDNSAIMSAFSGIHPLPFFDANGREHYLKMVFVNGVAEVVVGAGKLQPGKYRAAKRSSALADVVEHEIIVALSGA